MFGSLRYWAVLQSKHDVLQSDQLLVGEVKLQDESLPTCYSFFGIVFTSPVVPGASCARRPFTGALFRN